MRNGQFVLDIKAIRDRARRHIEDGAVTEDYKAKVPVVLRLLNESLATELVCVLRYKRHYFMAQGLSSESVKSEFLEHAKEEQAHADAIAGGNAPGGDLAKGFFVEPTVFALRAGVALRPRSARARPA